MNFRDYINKRGKQKPSSPPTEDDVTSAYQRYQGLSQEELMREMFRTAEDSRSRGELSDEALDSFYSQASSFLSPEQAERMRELIRELKK